LTKRTRSEGRPSSTDEPASPIDHHIRGFGPSIDGRPTRWMRQFGLRLQRLREELAHLGLSEAELERRVNAEVSTELHRAAQAKQRRDAQGLRPKHDKHDKVVRVHPSALVRATPLVEQAATVRSPQGRAVLAAMTAGTRGRPTSRLLAAAIAVYLLLNNQPPRFDRAFAHFTGESYATLEWAYEHPCRGAGTAQGVSQSAVREALLGRFQRSKDERKRSDRRHGRWVTKGLINRRDWQELFDDVTVWAWVQVRLALGLTMQDIVLSLDGTPMPVAKEQRRSFGDDDEAAINGTLDVGFRRHDRKWWRGINPVFATDPEVQVAPVVSCVGADDSEFREVPGLLKRIYAAYERLQAQGRIPADAPLEIAFLVGDKEYSRRPLCHEAIFAFGATPVFPVRQDSLVETVAHAANAGIPTCRCRGVSKDMRYHSAEDFYGPAQRRALGLAPGDDLLPVLKARGLPHPRIRFRCPGCGLRSDVWVKDAPHLYTYLPHKAVHKLDGRDQKRDRYLLRLDLLAMRNASESNNYALKVRGLAGNGALKPRWVRTRRQLDWLVMGRNWAHVMRLLNWLNGDLERAYIEANDGGLLAPRALREALATAASRPDEEAA
jgi:hypothetical protein